MMRRLLLLLLATIGVFSASGCKILNQGKDIVVEQQQEAAEQNEGAEGTGLPPIPEGADFSEPVVEATPASATVVAPDLIQSTNPDERTIGVQRTRVDPFAGLPIPPTPPEPIIATPTNSGAAAASRAASSGATTASNSGSGGSSAASANAGGSAASANAGGTSSGSGSSVAVVRPTPIAPLPSIPQPTAARAVRISGVVQIGGTPYAIVQAPDEVERYVRAGERLANGSVVVKRIDTRSIEPVVVLEQNGIEVERTVSGDSQDVVADTQEESASLSTPQASLTSAAALPTLPAPGI